MKVVKFGKLLQLKVNKQNDGIIYEDSFYLP